MSAILIRFFVCSRKGYIWGKPTLGGLALCERCSASCSHSWAFHLIGKVRAECTSCGFSRPITLEELEFCCSD